MSENAYVAIVLSIWFLVACVSITAVAYRMEKRGAEYDKSLVGLFCFAWPITSFIVVMIVFQHFGEVLAKRETRRD